MSLGRVGLMLCCGAALACAAVEPGGAGGAEEAEIIGEHVRGQVLAKFRPGVSEERVKEILDAQGAAAAERLGLPGVLLLRFPEDVSVADAVRRLSGLPEVEYAEPNYRVRIPEEPPGAK